MDLTAFLDRLSIASVPTERRYWFVRTDGGTHYSDFIMHNYIAISWDYLTVELFHANTEEAVKKVILNVEKSTPTMDDEIIETASESAKATTIYNKVKRFVDEMAVGDIVLCPSKNSARIAIGQIESEVYEDPEYALKYYSKDPESELIVCPYHKRRQVNWLKVIDKDRLDIYLARALNSQHSVSCLDEHASLINRSLHDLYTINGISHATLRTTRQSGISFADLRDFFNALDRNMEYASKALGVEYKPSELDVKLSIHSPGLIELAGASLIFASSFAIILFALNHYRHGGQMKTNFKLKVLGQEIEFGADATSRGTLDYKENERAQNLEALEKLSELQESLQMEFPQIDTLSFEVEEIVDEQVDNDVNS